MRRVAAGGRAIAPELAEAVWDAAPDPLTDRERAVLRMAEAGKSNKTIGDALGLSPGTVRNYLSEAAQKLGAGNRIEAGTHRAVQRLAVNLTERSRSELRHSRQAGERPGHVAHQVVLPVFELAGGRRRGRR